MAGPARTTPPATGMIVPWNPDASGSLRPEFTPPDWFSGIQNFMTDKIAPYLPTPLGQSQFHHSMGAGVDQFYKSLGTGDPNAPWYDLGNMFKPVSEGLDAAVKDYFGGGPYDAGGGQPAPATPSGYPHPAPGPEPTPGPPGGFDWTQLLNQGPTTTTQTYNSTPIDYTAGFPNAPQEQPIDWSQINQTFDQSRPKAPTIDKGNAIMAFLGAAARASAGAGNFAQALASAGGGGLLGLLDQRQQEQLMQNEYEKADQQWQASKAQMMTAQTSADRQIARQNMNAAYQQKVQLYQLELQNAEQKQTDVQASGNTVQVRQFNPNTGKIEYTIHQFHDGPSTFEKIQLLKALSGGGDGKMDLGAWGNLDDKDVPPGLKGVYNASTLIGSGAFPLSLLGQKGQVIQNMMNEFWTNNDSTDKTSVDRLRAQITALLISPEGQPMLREIYQYMGSGQ